MASQLYHSNYLFPDYPNALITSPIYPTPPGHVAGEDSGAFPSLMYDEKAPFDVVPRPEMAPPLVLCNANNATNALFQDWTVPTLPELRRDFHSPAPADMFCECGDDHRDGFYCNGNILCQLPVIMATHHHAVTSDHYTNSHVLEGKVNEEETLPEMKIGKYSADERKERILRYLKKRNQRNFNKTIKYECRKTLADKRVRIRGRFAKNNLHEPTSDEELMIAAEDKKHFESELVPMEDNNMMMMKQLQEYGGVDEIHEFWYQEALASLMYQQQMHPFLSH